MGTPGSSGKDGPTPISVVPDGAHDGEQVRPSFHFGMWHLSLGDRVVGIHRALKKPLEGVVVLHCQTVCLTTPAGLIFPIQSIAIHEVLPPLVSDEAVAA